MRISISRLLRPIMVVALLGLMVTLSGSSAGASDTDEITWQIEIKVTFTLDQMQQPGWEENTHAMQSALTARLQGNGTRLEITRAANAGNTEFTFRADGKGNAAQFKRVAFDDLSPVGGLIGGTTVLTLNGAATRGETLALVLESNPSTGYAWTINQVNAGVLNAVGQSQFRQNVNMPGASAKQTIKLNAAQDGNVSLALVYRRPWESETPARHVTLSAARLASLTDITNPAAPTAAQTTPPNLPVRPPASVGALPTSFDWRNNGGVNYLTPIRNQGNCGSCWAFATVAPFESNILIKDNVSTDLSEQFLVSCNTYGYNCTNGGWLDANDFHWNVTVPGDTGPGAVLESAFPYVAKDASSGAPCGVPYNHPYRLNGWAYVSGAYTIPSVSAIKNAIYNYGPVSAGVCAGAGTGSFSAYTGGIFSGNDCPSVGINHAITLVGWDDTTGTWILRNSWGTGWGENGYMRIVYGTSSVGYGAAYVVYNGAGVCYPLTWTASPTNSGSVLASPAPNCSDGTRYLQNTSVTVTAMPGCGRTFLSWGGDLSGSTNPTTITMNGNKNITANFAGSYSPCNYQLPFVSKSQSPTSSWITLASEDFEGSFPRVWTLYGTNGYAWGKRPCRPYAGSYSGWAVGSGTHGASLGCGASYPLSTETWMVYGPFSLANTSAAELRARIWTHTEWGYDTVSLMASIDNVTYAGNMYFGDWNWDEQVLDLANVFYLGNLLGKSQVWIAVIFNSDDTVNYAEGGYIDNVLLRKCPTGQHCLSSASPPASGNKFMRSAQMTLPR